MAHLPIPATQSALDDGLTPVQDELAWLLAEGVPIQRIVREVSGKDVKKAKRLRRQIAMLAERQDFQEIVSKRANAMAVMGVGVGVKALVRKASAGRVDAIKLLFEASGFYNPRLVQHEHSGEIQIIIKGANRPERQVEEFIGEAEVIE